MPHSSFHSGRCWLGAGQAGQCVRFVSCCDWPLERALPAYTFLPGCSQQTVRLQYWTCQLAPRSPSYEGSGHSGKAEWGLHHYKGPLLQLTLKITFIIDYSAEARLTDYSEQTEKCFRLLLFFSTNTPKPKTLHLVYKMTKNCSKSNV